MPNRQFDTTVKTAKPAVQEPATPVRPKLLVAGARDRCEREADRLAEQVLHKSGADVLRSSERSSAASFEAGAELSDRLSARRGSGRPIPDRTRAPMEDAFGADFSGVRVHTDAEASRLSTGIGARAFTYGRDIYFARGSYAPESAPGRKLLAHELTHVVQQQGQACAVQRAVGFEFEDGTWTVFVPQAGRQFIRPGWFFYGSPAPPDSELTEEEEKEQTYPGTNIWKEAAAPNHINNQVGRFNLQSAPKKGTLHNGRHYTIEPDGPYTEHGVTNRMDLEVVTKPFPETPRGYLELLEALEDMRYLFARFDDRATGEWAGEPFDYARFVGPDRHGFNRKEVYLYGGTPGGYFRPQVTGGVRLADLPGVFATLGARQDEPLEWGAAVAPIRWLSYGLDDPVRLATRAALVAQGNAARLAVLMVDALTRRGGAFHGDLDGLDGLEGFLSLVLVYFAVLSSTEKEGIKTQIPLLSRYPMSTLWTQIPKPTRDAVEEDREVFFRALDAVTKRAVASYLEVKYRNSPEIITDRADPGLDTQMLYVNLAKRPAVADALQSFTRREWFETLMEGEDLLTPRSLIARLTAEGGARGQVAAQYGKSLAVYLRGHGNTTNIRNVPGQIGEPLAILENRNARNWLTPKPGMSLEEIMSFAQQYFRWFWSVREGDPSIELR